MANYIPASIAGLPQPDNSDSLITPRAAKSWMWEHTRDCHEGLVGDSGRARDYNFKVSGKRVQPVASVAQLSQSYYGQL